MQQIGKQQEGQSHDSIKRMAWRALAALPAVSYTAVADVGGGAGAFAKQLLHNAGFVQLLDANPPTDLPGIQPIACDLNGHWPLPDESLSLLVSLEVIDHLENPRHFFREVYRLLQPGGYALISTPYNLNLVARLLFLLKGQHRHFQDLSYPAHITALLPIDIKRMAAESQLTIAGTWFNHHDVLPLLKWNIHLPFRLFSNSILFALHKA